MYTDLRKPEVYERWPSNIVEISPDDAKTLDIVSGDLISLSSDRIARNADDGFDTGSLTAAAYVSDIVPKGVLWTNFAYPDQWMNNVAPRFMHPVNPVTPFKLARATLMKIGSTDLAERISFLPRNIPPQKRLATTQGPRSRGQALHLPREGAPTKRKTSRWPCRSSSPSR